ncbi:MAG: Rieske 2Fe-2S domain-containing protein [Gemmatimonadaceae bacterium]
MLPDRLLDGKRVPEVVADGFRRALAVVELEPGIPQACRMPDGESLCLVRDGDAIYAMVDRCPHRDFNLSGGDMVAPGVIECPWHGAQFDCRTGAVLQGPATDDLVMYPVRVEGGDVYVGPSTQNRRSP